MNDQTTPAAEATILTPRARLLSRTAAALALGLIAGLLTLQLFGSSLAALGAAVMSGVIAFVAWGPLALRDGAVSIGRAGLVGALAVVAGYVGAALVGGAVSPVVADQEMAVALFFSVWIVVPVSIAVAVAVAVMTRAATRPAA